jgi:glycosyltransferase involved in cell wall biosynthesis
MRICIVGDFSDHLDEGYKNTSHYLARSLEAQPDTEVVRLNAKKVRTRQFWGELARAKPHVVHTIAQPTNISLFSTAMMRVLHPGARTVVSALRADRYFSGHTPDIRHRVMMQMARPDLVLVQTHQYASLFERLGCRVEYLPNGVDLERFKPVSRERHIELRRKYGLDEHAPVVLHVGHLEPDRNLTAFEDLPAQGVQVVVAGSLYMGTHHDLIARLEGAGLRLFKGYQPNVEELYQLADCYVFPLPPGNSLTMPLSVLEAMACNLPVLATRFSGLMQAFSGFRAYGFDFIKPYEPLLPRVQAMLAAREAGRVHTRGLVRDFSWEAVAARLRGYYDILVRRKVVA